MVKKLDLLESMVVAGWPPYPGKAIAGNHDLLESNHACVIGHFRLASQLDMIPGALSARYFSFSCPCPK